MSERRRLAAMLIALFFVSVALAVAEADLRNLSARITLDPSWAIDLENQWLLGRVSGRDFFFTYGPFAQVLTLISRAWRQNLSPLDGWMWTPLTGQVFRYLVTALLVAAIPKMTATRAALLFIVAWLTPTPWFTARQLLVVLSVVLLARSLAATRRAAVAWGVGAAIAALLGQLFTFEILVYVVASWLGLLGAALILTRLRPSVFELRPMLPGALAASGAWLLFQAAIEVGFRLTSRTYRPFEYLIENWQIAKGYNVTMGTPWLSDTPNVALAEATLVVIIVVVIAVCLRALFVDVDCDAILQITGMAGVALIVLKGAIVRADLIHVRGSLAPAWFLCALIATDPRAPVLRRGAMALGVALAFWAFGVETKGVVGLWEGPNPIRKLREAYHAPPIDPASLGAHRLRPQLSREQTLVYPYGNQHVVAAGKSSLAPIVQAYSAHTGHSQQRFVEELERYRGRLDVVFGEDDGHRVWVVDGVPSLTRTPAIFRYLLENFDLSGGAKVADDYYVLTPRNEPRRLAAQPVDAGPCALLEVDLRIDYGRFAALGRPLHAFLDVIGPANTVRVPVVPIEAGRVFSTLVFLGGASHRVHDLFRDGPSNLLGMEVRRATLALQNPTRFSTRPTAMSVLGMRCLVPAESAKWNAATDLLAESGADPSSTALLRIEGRDLFMHGGKSAQLVASSVEPGLCLRATLGWHSGAMDPKGAKAELRDGVTFVVELRDPRGRALGPAISVPLEVDQPDRELSVPLPANRSLRVRLAVESRSSDAWDWALWKGLRLEACEADARPATGAARR